MRFLIKSVGRSRSTVRVPPSAAEDFTVSFTFYPFIRVFMSHQEGLTCKCSTKGKKMVLIFVFLWDFLGDYGKI